MLSILPVLSNLLFSSHNSFENYVCPMSGSIGAVGLDEVRETGWETEDVCYVFLFRREKDDLNVSSLTALIHSHTERSQGRDSVATQPVGMRAHMHTHTHTNAFTLCSAMHHFDIPNISSQPMFLLYHTCKHISGATSALLSRFLVAIAIEALSLWPPTILNCFESPDISKQTPMHNTWQWQCVNGEHTM